jgi:hypothetical protein
MAPHHPAAGRCLMRGKSRLQQPQQQLSDQGRLVAGSLAAAAVGCTCCAEMPYAILLMLQGCVTTWAMAPSATCLKRSCCLSCSLATRRLLKSGEHRAGGRGHGYRHHCNVLKRRQQQHERQPAQTSAAQAVPRQPADFERVVSSGQRSGGRGTCACTVKTVS